MNEHPSQVEKSSLPASRTPPATHPLSQGRLSRIQFAFLAIVSCVLLLLAPSNFYFQPDTGIYVGGAESLLTSGSYRFGGEPILIYYPGFSLLLAAPIALFGIDFQVLHLFAALWCIAALWLIRSYYTNDLFASAGLLMPALLPFAGLFQDQALYILSDAAFLAWSFAALILWRRYLRTGSLGLLLLCILLVAFAPLIRYQGLFLVAAFSIALLIRLFDRKLPVLSMSKVVAIAFATLLPFLLWTLRNYLQHTPDTYNMANTAFFGKSGLALYSSDFHQGEGIDAPWRQGLHNFLYQTRNLTETLFGKSPLQWIRLEVIPLILGIFMLAGFTPWWHRATYMERAYVLISGLFIVVWALRSGSTYTVPRYWLPMLPFVLLIGIFGLGRLYALLPVRSIKPWLAAVYLALLVIMVSQGTERALTRLLPWADIYYRTSEQTRLDLARFVHASSKATDVIAVTDWGVLPISLQRRTISVLNDKDRIGSLRRIVDHGATHLVILEATSAMVEPAKEMVAELPQVFLPELVIAPEGPGAGGGVYRIDMEQAKVELERRISRASPSGSASLHE